MWTPDHLEVLLATIGDKAMACANSTFIDADDKPLGTTLKYQESFDGVPSDDMAKFGPSSFSAIPTRGRR